MHNSKQWLLVIFNNEETALIRAATHLPKRFLCKRTKTEDIRLGFRTGTFFLYLPLPCSSSSSRSQRRRISR